MAPLEGFKTLIPEVENTGTRAREIFRPTPRGPGSSPREATLIAGMPLGASRRGVVTTTLTQLKIVTATPAFMFGTQSHGDPNSTKVILLPSPTVVPQTPIQLAQTGAITTQPPSKTNAPDGDSPIHDDYEVPTSVSAVRAGDGHDIGDASKAFTSVEITTTFVTEGVYTADTTGTLPNGLVEVLTLTTSGTRTLTTSTQIPTQIPTVSSSGGPPKAIIGGVIGAIVIMVLALVAFCILRRKRSQRAKEAAPVSIVAHPFTGSNRGNPPAKQAADTRGSPTTNSAHSPRPSHSPDISHENSSSEEPKDPFRDPEPLDELTPPEPGVPEAGNALDHLQSLTTQLEAEFRRLSSLARLGQLSEADRARLDEIKRIANLTTPPDPRAGRVSLASTTSNTTTYSSPPPSYRSDSSRR